MDDAFKEEVECLIGLIRDFFNTWEKDVPEQYRMQMPDVLKRVMNRIERLYLK